MVRAADPQDPASPVTPGARAPDRAVRGDLHYPDAMALEVGIVGLPNSGKTTLFNALTRAGAEITAYASVYRQAERRDGHDRR